MNEVTKVEQIEAEISIIEQSHKSAILAVHENMQQLVNDCLSIEVPEDDKRSYDKAVELKRVVKATHVAIEKKRKELKQPLIDYGKRLDKWVEEIYNPLVNAEKIVKKKMEAYEAKQEKLKQERKILEEQQKNEEIQLDIRLQNLNAQLEKINLAKNKAELKEIENYLDTIVLSDFGKKSNEAGFILSQLKMTCSMASRLLKEEEDKPVEAPKMQTTPITDDLVEKLKENSVESGKKVIVGGSFNKISNENAVTEGLFNNSPIEPMEKEQNSVPAPEKNDSDDNFVFPHDLDKLGESTNNENEGGIENENQEVPKLDEQNVLIKQDGIFEEVSMPITEPLKESIKASDEDVIAIIDNISSNLIANVISLIEENTTSSLSTNNLDFSEYDTLIISEVKKRISVLLNK
jgi:hypothetical protein